MPRRGMWPAQNLRMAIPLHLIGGPPLSARAVQGGFRGLEQGLRRGVRPGEGAVREVAAFLLDHEHFAGVPPTALVSCHASASPAGADGKVGSLQV